MMREALSLNYVRPDQLADHLEKYRGHVLGAIGFGSSAGLAGQTLPPASFWVNIPVLGDYGSSFEVWTSSEPVEVCGEGNIAATTDGRVLFGSVQLQQAPHVPLEALAAQAYTEIFDFVSRRGYRHLWRVWHYFPQINDPENGLERYRCFNIGRHEAFVASGRSISEEGVPAASALGSDSGPLVIYFLAGRQGGQAIDNPRQISAYRYPDKYGPRSPTFARAMLATLGQRQCFFISGTASIVGYETVHKGDVERQTQETLLNIRTLLQELPEYDPDRLAKGGLLLKVYLRHVADLARVQALIEKEFGATQKAVYLHSNICRSDLLLEIEGAYFYDL
jgi:chorismate lyase/3-hydroxybenzoate synthase